MQSFVRLTNVTFLHSGMRLGWNYKYWVIAVWFVNLNIDEVTEEPDLLEYRENLGSG